MFRESQKQQTFFQPPPSSQPGRTKAAGDRQLTLDKLLKVSSLSQFRRVAEPWVISESTKELSYFTHGLIRFYGKFPPPVASRLIEEYSTKQSLVFDPMVGSGTTLVEASLLGRRSMGADINPLAVLITKVKVTPVDVSSVERQLSLLSSKFDVLVKRIDSQLPHLVPKLPRLEHWFFVETTRELAALKKFILQDIQQESVREVFLFTLAAILRKVSRASVGMGRMFFDPGYEHKPVLPIFRKKLIEMLPALRTLSAYEQKLVRRNVLLAKANQVPLDDDSVDLVICHPPYFNVYKYSSIYKFEMFWLGLDVPSVRASEVREAFKVGKPEKVSEYVEDLHGILQEQHRVLRPGGVCGLMIGDTIMHGKRVCTTSLVLDRAQEAGFKVEKLLVRKPILTEATYKTALRRKTGQLGANIYDFIVVLRK